jgi:hypothetical protein
MSLIVEKLPRAGVYIYVFCFYGRLNEPMGPVKIGITSNVVSRLAGVQTGQHQRLHALAAFNTPNREIARQMEASFHLEFASGRREGEWFDLAPITVLEKMCAMWRYYFQQMPDGIEYVGIPYYEREIRVLRAWRQHYAETSNVRAIA